MRTHLLAGAGLLFVASATLFGAEWPTSDELLAIATRPTATQPEINGHFFGQSVTRDITLHRNWRDAGEAGSLARDSSRVSRRIVRGGYLVETNARELPAPTKIKGLDALVWIEISWLDREKHWQAYRRARLLWYDSEWHVWMRAEGEEFSRTIFWLYRFSPVGEERDDRKVDIRHFTEFFKGTAPMPCRTWQRIEDDRQLKLGVDRYGGGISGPQSFRDKFFGAPPPYLGPEGG